MNVIDPFTWLPKKTLPGTVAILTLLMPSNGSAESTTLPADSPDHLRPRLLLPIDKESLSPPTSLRPPVLRPSRTLQLNPNFERDRSDWLQVGRHLRLDLLENQDVTLQIDAIRTLEDGITHVLGRSPKNPAQEPGRISFLTPQQTPDRRRLRRVAEPNPEELGVAPDQNCPGRVGSAAVIRQRG